ncbi:MAG: DUF4831 family protein [Bacteroidales bacterium]|nr:DUF4831 family protein [Bacteroidales bacterium]
MIRNKSLVASVLVFVVMLMIKNLDLAAQITTYPVSDPQQFSGKHGLFYSLPKTYFNIEVNFKETSGYRGPLSNYAFDYLGIEHVINENSVSYELNDVILVPRSSPDPEHFYFIEYGVKEAKEERSIEIELTNSGFLVSSGINWPHNEEDFEVIETKDVGHLEVPPDEKELFPYFATYNRVEKIDTIINFLTTDTGVVEQVEYNTTLVPKTLSQRAKEAADQIIKIRENRFNLLTGYQEINYEQGTIEYMDGQLIEMEDAYNSLFRGLEIVKERQLNFFYTPEADNQGKQEVLFRFSSDEGTKNATSSSGEPVYIVFETLGPFWGVGSKITDSSIQQENNGYVYRIPELCRVKIIFRSDVLFCEDFVITQFGSTVVVSSTEKINLDFYPATGGIRELQVK